jgi:hypothetical protein
MRWEMRRVIGAVVAALLVGGTILVGTAGAHTFVTQPRVSINKSPAGATAPGDRVLIFGKVKGRNLCTDHRQVTLFRTRSGADESMGTDRTDREGEYRFAIRPHVDGLFYVSIRGLRDTSYGHSHRCRGDRSPSIFVDVN